MNDNIVGVATGLAGAAAAFSRAGFTPTGLVAATTASIIGGFGGVAFAENIKDEGLKDWDNLVRLASTVTAAVVANAAIYYIASSITMGAGLCLLALGAVSWTLKNRVQDISILKIGGILSLKGLSLSAVGIEMITMVAARVIPVGTLIAPLGASLLGTVVSITLGILWGIKEMQEDKALFHFSKAPSTFVEG